MLSNNANPDLTGVTLPKPGHQFIKGAPCLGDDDNWYIEDGLGGWLFLAAGTDPPIAVPVIERKINILPLQSAIISSVTNGEATPGGGSVTITSNTLETTTTVAVTLGTEEGAVVTFGNISVTSSDTQAQIATKVQNCINTDTATHGVVATATGSVTNCVYTGNHPTYVACVIALANFTTYTNVPFTGPVAGPKIIVIETATEAQLLYNYARIAIVGKDFEATNVTSVINGSTITLTCPNANITGVGTPSANDVLCCAYATFAIVHNLNTFRVLMCAFVKLLPGADLKRNIPLESEIYNGSTITANIITVTHINTSFYYAEFMSLDIN